MVNELILRRAYRDKIAYCLHNLPERSVGLTAGADGRHAQQAGGSTAHAEEATPVPSVPAVSMQWLRVVPGLYHTLLRITPTNQAAYAQDPRFQNFDEHGRRYATLGAGPGGAFWGRLVSARNRENDVEDHESGIAIPLPAGISEDAFIHRMLKTDREYPDDLEYGSLPHPPIPYRGIGPSYNSNSYVAGLLRAVGAVPPTPPVTAPGYGLPVPLRHFAR